MAEMNDTDGAALAAGLARMSETEARGFMVATLSERRLHRIMRALNEEVLSADPMRKRVAEGALSRMGFL